MLVQSVPTLPNVITCPRYLDLSMLQANLAKLTTTPNFVESNMKDDLDKAQILRHICQHSCLRGNRTHK